eukprot:5211162-Pleurochrysis_carterae.AAC.2
MPLLLLLLAHRFREDTVRSLYGKGKRLADSLYSFYLTASTRCNAQSCLRTAVLALTHMQFFEQLSFLEPLHFSSWTQIWVRGCPACTGLEPQMKQESPPVCHAFSADLASMLGASQYYLVCTALSSSSNRTRRTRARAEIRSLADLRWSRSRLAIRATLRTVRSVRMTPRWRWAPRSRSKSGSTRATCLSLAGPRACYSTASPRSTRTTGRPSLT